LTNAAATIGQFSKAPTSLKFRDFDTAGEAKILAHQRLAAEAGIGTQNDFYLRPALADLFYDALYFCERTSACLNVAGPQPYAQQLLATHMAVSRYRIQRCCFSKRCFGKHLHCWPHPFKH
jgi:hypothetical protein